MRSAQKASLKAGRRALQPRLGPRLLRGLQPRRGQPASRRVRRRKASECYRAALPPRPAAQQARQQAAPRSAPAWPVGRRHQSCQLQLGIPAPRALLRPSPLSPGGHLSPGPPPPIPPDPSPLASNYTCPSPPPSHSQHSGPLAQHPTLLQRQRQQQQQQLPALLPPRPSLSALPLRQRGGVRPQPQPSARLRTAAPLGPSPPAQASTLPGLRSQAPTRFAPSSLPRSRPLGPPSGSPQRPPPAPALQRRCPTPGRSPCWRPQHPAPALPLRPLWNRRGRAHA